MFPSASTLKTIQNKSIQKDFYKNNNLPTSKYKNYNSLTELLSDFNNNKIQLPAVWKSAKFGYDGKGVKIIENSDDLNSLPDVEY